MASTTHNLQSPPTHRHRSHSRPGSRPTTPLRRPNSRSSIRQISVDSFPLNAVEPQFSELADSMGTLEANFQELQVMHDSISRFNENFSAFLFGLNMNAFCIDFPEGPMQESFKRVAGKEAQGSGGPRSDFGDPEITFMTSDTSFVADPSVAAGSVTPAPATGVPPKRVPSVRGGGVKGNRRRGGSELQRGRGGSISYR